MPEDRAFCPKCGKDNRPPNERKYVKGHRHIQADGGKYCIHCGVKANDDGSATQGGWHRIAGVIMLIVGVLLLLGSVFSILRGRLHIIGIIFGVVVGLYLLGHGWYWVRGIPSDFNPFEDIRDMF
jgi:hypothetical protein